MFPKKSILYYPSIEFQNDAWIKSSLLLWDNIYRIVPQNYTPNDNATVKTCLDSGLIRSVLLENDDLKSVSLTFLDFLDKLHFMPAGLDNRYTDRLHKDKIDHRLYPFIEEIAGHCDPEGFYHVRNDISRGYMFYLANSVAGRRNLALATDNRDAWSIMPYFIDQANFDDQVWNPKAEGYYTSLIFTDLLPMNIEYVDIKTIINFVDKRKDERERLRNVICELALELSQCSSREHGVTLRQDFLKDMERAKDDFRKSSGFINDDIGYSLLVVGLPVGLSLFSAIGMKSDPYEPSGILPSVIFGAIAAYLDYRRARNNFHKDSPVSFLVDIDKQLKKHHIPLYWRSFEEFIND